MSTHPQLSIVVPCYNEAANLPSLIRRFEEIRRPDSDWELLLVDNGSVDNTAKVLKEELQRAGREFVRVVTVSPPNVGYGHGIMTGLRAARGRFLAWTHADGQTPPADVLRAFETLLAASDTERTLVKGLRKNRPLKDTLFTLGMQAAAAALVREHLVDINGQPKVFSRRLLELAKNPPNDLSLDLYFLFVARSHRFDIRTIDVFFGEREHGESRWAFNWKSKARNIMRTVKYMKTLRDAPTGTP